ncbi:Ig-like domain-containing protein, partial [Rhizosaccharibacter radicis]|uniref:Ig-like domain-containing protein n=1 Tax=Rhizosaccharibacter radicis TaxID=2782605 RepID=UPI003BF57CF1
MTSPSVTGQVTTLADGTHITNNPTPVLRGLGVAGNQVNLYYANTGGTQSLLGTTTVAANGTWYLVAPTALPDGTYQITTTQTDSLGGVSAPSSPQSLTIDTHTPTAPTISS